MQEEPNPLNPGESELEMALGRLAPQGVADRREEIAFEAGRRVGRRAAMPWRICSGALAACLALSLVPRVTPTSSPVPVAKVSAPQPVAAQLVTASRQEPPMIAGTYLVVREEVLEKGLDALPASGGRGGTGQSRAVPRALDVRDASPMQLNTLFGVRS